jgi:hypothetical protein
VIEKIDIEQFFDRDPSSVPSLNQSKANYTLPFPCRFACSSMGKTINLTHILSKRPLSQQSVEKVGRRIGLAKAINPRPRSLTDSAHVSRRETT